MRCLYYNTLSVLLLILPFMACGPDLKPETQTSVKWRGLARSFPRLNPALARIIVPLLSFILAISYHRRIAQ